MSIPFKKFGYTINPITDEINTPQIFLVSRKLNVLGELTPISDLDIKVNEVNVADEVSFTYYKENEGEPTPFFDKLVDLSVIKVDGFGYFEVSIDTKEESAVYKTITAQSLGICELSQRLLTVEVNTEDDIAREDYNENLSTIFYRNPDDYESYDWDSLDRDSNGKYHSPLWYTGETEQETIELRKAAVKGASLIHRMMTYAPSYEIGHIDETLWFVKREFSWSDTDIMSALNDVAEEVQCIFYVEVTKDENGKAIRKVHAYDMQYCEHCWNEAKSVVGGKEKPSKFRTILNGVCQNCNQSKYIKDIGEDTNIFITTSNLTDSITLETDKDSIKNCFKIRGGDDLMTSAVQAINLSATGNILEFSKDQKNLMSPELINMLERYQQDYDSHTEDYEKLTEIIYNTYDVIPYITSGKMPLIEREISNIPDCIYETLRKISTYYNNRFYLSTYDYYKSSMYITSVPSAIRKKTDLYCCEGFSAEFDSTDFTASYAGQDLAWNSKNTYQITQGSIKFYETGNPDVYFTLFINSNSCTLYDPSGNEYSYGVQEKDALISNFRIIFNFADMTQEAYMGYLTQEAEDTLAELDVDYANERNRDWNEYAYNPLDAYFNGYQECIDTLDLSHNTKSKEYEDDIYKELRPLYLNHQNNISSQMQIRLDQAFALYSVLGDFSNDDFSAYFLTDGEVDYELQKHSSIAEVFENMLDPTKNGGYNSSGTTFTPGYYIGDKAIKCKLCDSTNIVNTSEKAVCCNCGNSDSSEMYTYFSMVQDIYDYYRDHSDEAFLSIREKMQDDFDIKNYFEKRDAMNLYYELMSFIREDVYDNSNYVSDGLTNNELIEKAKELTDKAKMELVKASSLQYTINTDLSSIVGQKSFEYQGITVNDDYSKFLINNYVRVKIDGQVYKMRISSIGYTFPISGTISVDFTNVSRYGSNKVSDVAEVLSSATSMATTYNAITNQSEQGQLASNQLNQFKNEGLDTALMAIKAGTNQDITIDEHGILLRKKNEETNLYDNHQLKLINRNIVFTDDNWQSSKLAIGLGSHDGDLVYGVWADVLVGDLLVGNKLKIANEDNTVVIDENGLSMTKGRIELGAGKGSDGVSSLFLVDPESGTLRFEGEICATNGIFSGRLEAAEGTFSGELEGVTGTFSTCVFNESLISRDKLIIENFFINDHNGLIKFDTFIDPTTSISFQDLRILNETYDENFNTSISLGISSSASTYRECLGVFKLNNDFYVKFFEPSYFQSSATFYSTTSFRGVSTFLHNAIFNEDVISKNDIIIESDTNGIYFGSNDSSDVFLRHWHSDTSPATNGLSINGALWLDGRLCVGNERTSSGSAYKVSIDGNGYINGAWTSGSDRRIKNSISDVNKDLIKLFDSYEIKEYKKNNEDNNIYHIGVIAQDFSSSLSSLNLDKKYNFVTIPSNEDDILGVCYDEINILTALKVKDMDKKHSSKIIELETKIDNLEKEINLLKST